ncbi:MAG: hypothetical protein IKH89_00345 [Bacteroidales bacterium]|nr:hypothetical protein [Bacteroidales bacterium]
MIILTLFFIYPLCPDEINLTANEQIEVLDSDFDEEQVEGEISLSRKSQTIRRSFTKISSQRQSFAKDSKTLATSLKEFTLSPYSKDILLSSCLLRL